MTVQRLPTSVRIALAGEASIALTDLLCELNAYYADEGIATAPLEAVHAHLRDHLLAPGAPSRLVVASDAAGTALGLAAIVLLDSLVDPAPGHRRQCMVKELFVSERSRGQGIGRALMAWVAGYAAAQGCGRMDWNVMDSNAQGIAFYEGLGARRVSSRLSYRLNREAMERLAVPQAPLATSPHAAP
jgi:ribosomal protein S18 acetylase RimI-like enzyme